MHWADRWCLPGLQQLHLQPAQLLKLGNFMLYFGVNERGVLHGESSKRLATPRNTKNERGVGGPRSGCSLPWTMEVSRFGSTRVWQHGDLALWLQSVIISVDMLLYCMEMKLEDRTNH